MCIDFFGHGIPCTNFIRICGFMKIKNQFYFPYEINIEHEYTEVYRFLWILLIQIKYNFLPFNMSVSAEHGSRGRRIVS